MTTPPTVCTASCCTTPSTGATSTWSLVRCSALISILRQVPAAFCSAFDQFVEQRASDIPRRSCARVSLSAASAASASRQLALLDHEILLLLDEILQHLER